MDTIYWRMNATQGGANLHPGVNLLTGANLHPGANCAHEHGLKKEEKIGSGARLVSGYWQEHGLSIFKFNEAP